MDRVLDNDRCAAAGGRILLARALLRQEQNCESRKYSERSNARCNLNRLRHSCQGQVVAITALVIHLITVAVVRKGRTVGKVTERAGNRCCCGIVNYSKNGAGRECAAAKIAKGKVRATIDGHTLGD